ncbi:hypothetical protein ACJMK2_037801 [Sinanodonta woodiana]|uniref:Equilibrative nucleoside transporter 3 n=1 Tax=Sinanodonta woodiana TaxID=1069815 RepID=A0ABD3WLL1_SINWO
MDADAEPLLAPAYGPVPKDRFFLVYFIFCLLGLGSLCPWNFFITASEYFKYKLRNTTLPEGSDYLNPLYQTYLQTKFESYVTVASTIPNLMVSFLTALLIKRISLKARMYSSIILTILLFSLTLVLTKVNTDTWQTEFFILTIICVVIVSASSSVLGASMFGLASLFPSRYVQACMSGQAMGGIFAAVANIVALAVGSDVTQSGLGFFLAATLTAVATLVSYILLYHLEFSKYHIFDIGRSLDDNVNHRDEVVISTRYGCTYYYSILKLIWVEGLCVCLVFFVTLSVFPSIASAIASTETGAQAWSEKYFSALVCFLLYNAGDLGGRCISGYLQVPKFGQRCCLFMLAVVRVGFIPLLMLCNAQPRHLPVVFTHDAYPVLFILFLGLTNGFLSTLAMMYGPKKAPPDMAESTGAIMSVCLTIGLVSGSLFSLLLVASL